MAQIGSLIEYGFTFEDTAGTAQTLTSAEFLPNSGGDLDDSKEDVTLQAGYGRIENIAQSRESLLKGGGKVVFPFGIYNAVYAGVAIFGAVPTPTDNADGTYTREFTITNNNTHKTATVVKRDPEFGYKAFAGQALNDFQMEAEKNGEFIVFDSNWMGKKSSTPTDVTPSYDLTEHLFTPDNVEVFIASNEAGLAGASALTAEKVSWGVQKNVEIKGKLGSNEVDRVRNKRFGGTGSLDVELDGNTEFDLALANTARAMRIRLTVPGTSPVEKVEFDIINFTYDTPVTGKDLDALGILTRAFKLERRSGGMLKMRVINDKATYPFES